MIYVQKLSTMTSLMNRFATFVLLLFLVGQNIQSQDVRYYKLSSERVGGSKNTIVSGGQFITFLSDICYESDKKGNGVGHGDLTRNKGYSNAQYTVYQGSSYWGSSTTFKFNADKSVLNVVLDNGDIYVYKRATPPAGVKTCSLIRKPSSNGGSSSGGYIPAGGQPPSTYTPQPTPNNNNSRHNNPSPRYEERTYTCTYCHGKGTVTDCDSSIPDFSGNGKYCSECGRHVPMCHIHKRCPSCGGKGTYTKMERAN